MLSRTECTAMRGLAIVAIALHNYCHFISGIVQENEYTFRAANNDRLWQVLTHPDLLLPVHLLSYLGHYGVPLFLFLSGYGLVFKYERPTPPATGTRAVAFLRYHYLKLLRLLAVGFVLFIVADMVTPGRFHFLWQHVVAQFAMVINFLPAPNKVIWPGIYWFFGLMMQLYVVYRLLLFRRSSVSVLLPLVAACWAAQCCCDPQGATLNWLRYNCFGAIMPFATGILLARHGQRLPFGHWSRPAWLLVAAGSAFLLLAMCFNFHTWLWVPLMAIVCCTALVKALPAILLRGAAWLGLLSAPIFITHPATRKLLIAVAWKDGIYDGLLLYALVTICLSWAVMQVLGHIPRPRP